MISDCSNETISEIERLLNLSVRERETEGIYATDSQLKLLLKRVRSARQLSGVTKFVADFCSLDSMLLRLVDKLEAKRGSE